MQRSYYKLSPVISLLSSSPAKSRRIQDLLSVYFGLKPLSLNNNSGNDDLSDDINQLDFPGFNNREWNSVASQCPSSGTIIHLISLVSNNTSVDKEDGSSYNTTHNKEPSRPPSSPLSLLAITEDGEDSIWKSRKLLASHMKNASLSSKLKLSISNMTGQSITASNILGTDNGLPLIDIPSNIDQEMHNSTDDDDNTTTDILSPPCKGLKEIAIPFYDDAKYTDGESILSKLSNSSLSRPVVGVYQWPMKFGMALRPIPSAKEDRSLPRPSFVFRCNNLEDVEKELLPKKTTESSDRSGMLSLAKIGYSGTTKRGQFIIMHDDLMGLDIRLDDSNDFTSHFSEAQDALFASSIDELQNTNVLLEGGKENVKTRGMDDPRSNVADCWVEFRANMKNPSGFISKRKSASTSGRSKHRIAKPVDIPYE